MYYGDFGFIAAINQPEHIDFGNKSAMAQFQFNNMSLSLSNTLIIFPARKVRL